MNATRDPSRILVLRLSVVLLSLMTGCAAGAHSSANRPTYLAQVTCWDSLSCCIQKFPLTAAQHCGAGPADIAKVFNSAALLHEAMRGTEAQLKEEAQAQEDAKAGEAEGVAAPEPPTAGARTTTSSRGLSPRC